MTTSIARTDIASSARLWLIAKPIKQTAELGPVSLLAVGGTVGLDGMEIAHVVFENVEVHYNGGPLILRTRRLLTVDSLSIMWTTVVP